MSTEGYYENWPTPPITYTFVHLNVFRAFLKHIKSNRHRLLLWYPFKKHVMTEQVLREPELQKLMDSLDTVQVSKTHRFPPGSHPLLNITESFAQPLDINPDIYPKFAPDYFYASCLKLIKNIFKATILIYTDLYMPPEEHLTKGYAEIKELMDCIRTVLYIDDKEAKEPGTSIKKNCTQYCFEKTYTWIPAEEKEIVTTFPSK